MSRHVNITRPPHVYSLTHAAAADAAADAGIQAGSVWVLTLAAAVADAAALAPSDDSSLVHCQ